VETAFYFLPFHIDTECPKLESRKFITTTRTISVPIRPKVTETALLSLSKLQKKSLVYLTVCVCAVNDAAFMKFKECLSVFSERELSRSRSLSPIRLSVVCRLSVCRAPYSGD